MGVIHYISLIKRNLSKVRLTPLKKFFIGGLVIFILLFVYSLKKSSKRDYILKSNYHLKLLKSSKKIWSVWRKGPYSDLYKEAVKECPLDKFEGKLNCNLNFLNCVLNNSSISSEKKGVGKLSHSEAVSVQREEYGDLSPIDGVRLNLSLDKTKITILLEDNCDKLFLPKRIYGFGAEVNPPKQSRFDNFERLIFVDKNLSSAKGKTVAQMRKLCASRGMQLMESHILDAAAFHPVDLRNNRPLEFLRPKLPWSRNYKSEFPYKARFDKKFKFKDKYCDYLYSKECSEKKDTSLPSWMGLKNPLGGKVEVVRNIRFKDQILVPSSTYFTVDSLWHQLGIRALWNGEGFEKRDFNFSKMGAPVIENLSELNLGFRCMQEVWQ